MFTTCTKENELRKEGKQVLLYRDLPRRHEPPPSLTYGQIDPEIRHKINDGEYYGIFEAICTRRTEGFDTWGVNPVLGARDLSGFVAA